MNLKVKANFSMLKETKWYEYGVRFLIGGGITVFAGVIAKVFGPTIGGLFLAFPAIFPASATLIEKHEKEKKEKVSVDPGFRGQIVVALDAAGATMGAIGLIVFAALTWQLLPAHETWAVLSGSTIAWFIVSVAIWRIAAG
jgi:Protein of unknown function (DUF3147)